MNMIEVPRPTECYWCERFLSRFNIQCLYITNGSLCDQVQTCMGERSQPIMKYIVKKINEDKLEVDDYVERKSM